MPSSTNIPKRKLWVPLAILSLAASAWSVDLGTYKGCAANDGQFKQTQLFKGPTIAGEDTANGALKMAFAQQPDGSVDVYFVQKHGTVRRYNGKTGKVDSLANIPVDGKSEYGLVGIAARADFLANPYLYFMYSFKEQDGTFSHRISRFKMAADMGSLNLASEKILIKIVRKSVSWHTSGSMAFDAYGDLWFAVGDNEQTENGPANTADLRGGINRIHPDDSPKGYSIPAGNFGEHLSAKFKAQGNAVLAAQYADTSKVKPEVYVKGTRNAYTIDLDPVRRWLVWGDVGPDQSKVSEEYNLVKEPFYMGWPYFAGQEDMGGVQPYDIKIPTGALRSGPINNAATNTGVKQLPPIREPIFARSEGCAMTGPIFRYDGSFKGANAIPPQLDRKWLISGCDSYGFHLMTLDAAGETVVNNTQIFLNIKPATLVDLKLGPDGVLYYISWNTGLYRIDYTGTCKDAGFKAEMTGCGLPGYANYDPALPTAFNDPALCSGGTGVAKPLELAKATWLHVDAHSVSIDAAGPHSMRVLDMRGRMAMEANGQGRMSYSLASLPAPALYQVIVKTSQGAAMGSVLVGM